MARDPEQRKDQEAAARRAVAKAKGRQAGDAEAAPRDRPAAAAAAGRPTAQPAVRVGGPGSSRYAGRAQPGAADKASAGPATARPGRIAPAPATSEPDALDARDGDAEDDGLRDATDLPDVQPLHASHHSQGGLEAVPPGEAHLGTTSQVERTPQERAAAARAAMQRVQAEQAARMSAAQGQPNRGAPLAGSSAGPAGAAIAGAGAGAGGVGAAGAAGATGAATSMTDGQAAPAQRRTVLGTPARMARPEPPREVPAPQAATVVPVPPEKGPLAKGPAPGTGARVVTEIPRLPPMHREIESSPIVPDRAWVRILVDEKNQSYLYQVIEPQLSPDERKLLEFLRDTLIRTLDGRKAADKTTDWKQVLLDATTEAIKDHHIRVDEVSRARLDYYLVRDFLGFGLIDVLMRDPMIEDISCDGPGIPIYLFHRKYEAIRTSVVWQEELELDGFVIRLAQRSGKHISVADPILDATLPDGSRLQATLSREVTTRGSSFTIRKFRADPLTPPDLIRYGTMSTQMAAFFWFVMEMGASFILAGGTASGKTTSLNAISQFIPPEKKIISIEDTREINLLHENWIAGITRSGFGAEGASGKRSGQVDMYKLLEAALRQRPEYLLVGEVRGPEAFTLFQAMATGHACYSTMHADAVTSAVYRLENEPINVPRLMLQTLDIVLIQSQVRLKDRMARRIKEVTELVGFDPETQELLTNTVFEWDVASDTHRYLGKSYILEQVMEARNLSEEDLQKEWANRIEMLEYLMKHDIRHYAEVAALVSSYYRDANATLQRIRAAQAAAAAPASPAPATPVPTPPAPGAPKHG